VEKKVQEHVKKSVLLVLALCIFNDLHCGKQAEIQFFHMFQVPFSSGPFQRWLSGGRRAALPCSPVRSIESNEAASGSAWPREGIP
jgi:hypothetical protein